MKNESLGNMIAALRKENGMTQLQLAEKMGVTDKAVSKWERDLAYPDIHSIPKLAEIFNISVDELMQVKQNIKEDATTSKILKMVPLILKAVALAMGVAVVVLSCINKIETNAAISMLGIGLTCLALIQLSKKEE